MGTSRLNYVLLPLIALALVTCGGCKDSVFGGAARPPETAEEITGPPQTQPPMHAAGQSGNGPPTVDGTSQASDDATTLFNDTQLVIEYTPSFEPSVAPSIPPQPDRIVVTPELSSSALLILGMGLTAWLLRRRAISADFPSQRS